MALLSKGNAKMRRTAKEFGVKLFSFGIPAYRTAAGKVTCPFAKDCVAGCYAKQGAFVWSNVAQAFERRYEATLLDEFPTLMRYEIQGSKATHIRIHDSGDFYSPKYLEKWLQIAMHLPEVTFYFYTKSVEMVKKYMQQMPNNMFPIFSFGGKQDQLIDMETDRHARVFSSQNDLADAGYTDCTEFDLLAINTQHVGLVYHGAKGKAMTL